MSKLLKVSNSKINCWRRCHNMYYYRYIMKIEKKRSNINFTIGKLFHNCTEDLANGKSPNKSIALYRNHLKKLLVEEQVMYEDGINLVQGMIANYVNKYKKDDYTVRGIEVALEYELTKDIIFIGFIDKIIDNGRLAILEHKTCKTIPEESVRVSDMQTLLYAEGMKQCNLGTPKEIIWDYSRKKLPTIPMLLKSGKGLSVAKNIDTTYQVYLKAITSNKLKISDYSEILKSLKNKPDTFFRRITYPISKHQTKLIVDDVIRTAIEIKHLGEFDRTRNFNFQCGTSCDYYQLCIAETMNVDIDFILKKQYKERSNDKNGKKDKNPF